MWLFILHLRRLIHVRARPALVTVHVSIQINSGVLSMPPLAFDTVVDEDY